ncbi:MAG TPA: peptidoglycan-binding domain-containing protein [Chthoniobacterales bacterium]
MIGPLRADDNVRAVQSKLRDDGFYFGEIDGAYSSALAAALTRYQIRNGLPITGQLDIDTSKALGAKPAVTKPAGEESTQTSETWRRLRKHDKQVLAKASPPPKPTTQQVDSPPSAGPAANAAGDDMSTERLRDYVAAFVLAGLDPQVGAETDFFAKRVQYYDDGVIDREKIRKDLQRYDARWPERKFWLAGDLKIERQSGDRWRVTFPLRFELRNGEKHSSGKVEKTIVLEPSGEDWQIVAVNERAQN